MPDTRDNIAHRSGVKERLFCVEQLVQKSSTDPVANALDKEGV